MATRINLSREHEILFNGERPKHLIKWGIDKRGYPWFKCFVAEPIDDIEFEISGLIDIKGWMKKTHVTLKASIDFAHESAVTITYSCLASDGDLASVRLSVSDIRISQEATNHSIEYTHDLTEQGLFESGFEKGAKWARDLAKPGMAGKI